MNYILLDLEWNQARNKGHENPRIPFEIIEIGAVKIDEDGRFLDRYDALIRPVLYPQLFEKVKEVVDISNRELKREGRSFVNVIEEFLNWCGEDYRFCTWGSMDLTELQKNMAYYGVEIPFPLPFYYYDIQKLYSIQYLDGRSRCSLETAVEELKIPVDEPFHRAVSDAQYTGLVMEKLDMQHLKKLISVDYFRVPRTKKEEIYLVFDGYSKFVSKMYPNREEAMRTPNVSSTVCYRCGNNVKRRLNWFPDQSKHFYSLSFCPIHGWMKGKIRVKKAPGSDQIFMVKTLKLVSKEEAAKIILRHDQILEKRRLKKEQKEENSRQIKSGKRPKLK